MGNVIRLRQREPEITSAVQQLRRSQIYQEVARDLDFAAVCLIGCEGPVPDKIGSNATRWPVRIVASKDPATAAKRPDIEQPIHAIVCLEHVWTASETHARRLKAEMDKGLLGDDPSITRLRHSWRDVSEPSVAWEVLLVQAQSALGRGRGNVVFFSDAEREAIILDHVKMRLGTGR
jgi:hypothetical protein